MVIFILAALRLRLRLAVRAHAALQNPTPFGLHIGIEYLFMAVVGGAAHVWGALVGAGVITVLKQWLQDLLPKLFGTSGNFEVIFFGADGAGAARARRLWPILVSGFKRFIPVAAQRRAVDRDAVEPLPRREPPRRQRCCSRPRRSRGASAACSPTTT